MDGNRENRKGTISVFNGPQPELKVFDSETDEIAYVSRWIADRQNEGLEPHELGFSAGNPR